VNLYTNYKTANTKEIDLDLVRKIANWIRACFRAQNRSQKELWFYVCNLFSILRIMVQISNPVIVLKSCLTEFFFYNMVPKSFPTKDECQSHNRNHEQGSSHRSKHWLEER